MIFQVGATLLDACVLSVLRHEDTYGYILTQTLMGKLEISESTLYPVLRRLQKEEYLSTYNIPHMGRNRRYYSITERGKRQDDIYKAGWDEYKTRIDSLIFAEASPFQGSGRAVQGGSSQGVMNENSLHSSAQNDTGVTGTDSVAQGDANVDVAHGADGDTHSKKGRGRK